MKPAGASAWQATNLRTYAQSPSPVQRGLCSCVLKHDQNCAAAIQRSHYATSPASTSQLLSPGRIKPNSMRSFHSIEMRRHCAGNACKRCMRGPASRCLIKKSNSLFGASLVAILTARIDMPNTSKRGPLFSLVVAELPTIALCQTTQTPLKQSEGRFAHPLTHTKELAGKNNAGYLPISRVCAEYILRRTSKTT